MFKRNKPATSTVHTPRSRKALEGDNPLARRLRAEDEPATIDLESGDGFENRADASPAEPLTRHLDETELPNTSRAGDDSHDIQGPTVCGILLVLSGPARGDILTLHYGENQVIRSDNGSFSIDRDNKTGAEPVVGLRYEPGSRQFEVTPGLPDSPVSIDGDELASSRVLAHGQHINAGPDEFRLVTICNDTFSWQADRDDSALAG